MLGKNKKQLVDDFRQKCRTHNLKMTPQRLAIYEELIKSCDHPCADDIFNHTRKAFPDISIDTVYRTITTFSEIGLVNTVEGYGEAKRYDPDTQPHHHFRCKKCGKIIDFTEESFNKLQVPKKIREKYTVSDLKVVIEGLCEKCS
jgi:Fur family peroxide stress response transcriptional regulator